MSHCASPVCTSGLSPHGPDFIGETLQVPVVYGGPVDGLVRLKIRADSNSDMLLLSTCCVPGSAVSILTKFPCSLPLGQ